MPKAKKRLLPKDFDALIRAGDLDALKAVFDVCEIDARGGYTKRTALAFYGCPEKFTRWLVASGADIEATDTYGRTPLHATASIWNGRVDTLLELGAAIQAKDTNGDTPLHAAAKFANVEAVRALLDHGARVDDVNNAGLTPLAAGLRQCDNVKIARMAQVAELLLPRTRTDEPKGLSALLKRLAPVKTQNRAADVPDMRASVRRIGETFEFHRANFNPDSVDEASAGLDRLYALFDVPAVPRRNMHDGRSPIVAVSSSWQDQHEELWALLVPSSGAATTVQGEVIRISGRIANEVEGNGAVNWDAEYKAMARAFLSHLSEGSALPAPELEEASRLVAHVRSEDGASIELCRLAVEWVKLNPDPAPLGPVDYRR